MRAEHFARRHGLGEADWLDPNPVYVLGVVINNDNAISLTHDEEQIYNACSTPDDPRWLGTGGNPKLDCLMEKKFLVENALKIRKQNELAMQQQQQVIATQLALDRQKQEQLLQQQAQAAAAAIAQANQARAAAEQAAQVAQQQATAAAAEMAEKLKAAAAKAVQEANAAIQAHNQTAQANAISSGSYDVGSGEGIPGAVTVTNPSHETTAAPASIPWGLILTVGSAFVLGQ